MAYLDLSKPPAELQQDGAWVRIRISAATEEVKEGRAVGLEYPEPIEVNALVDTGASITIINPQLARTCKLRQTGFADVVSISSSGRFPEHAAAIAFPFNFGILDTVKVVASEIVR